MQRQEIMVRGVNLNVSKLEEMPIELAGRNWNSSDEVSVMEME